MLPPAPPVGLENNHGAISAVCVTGSLKAGNLILYTLDSDLQCDRSGASQLNSIWEDGPAELNSLWEYRIGAGPMPYEGFQTNRLWTPGTNEGVSTVDSVIMDMDHKKGFFYITSFRAGGVVTCSGLVVRTNISLSAPSAFSSFDVSRRLKVHPNRDILHGAAAVAVCPNQPYAAVLRDDGCAWVLPLLKGIPVLRKRMWLDSFPSSKTSRAIRFDAAGNLYVAGGQGMLRVFSPGGKTVAITGNNAAGTAGTFKLIRKDLPPATQTAEAKAPAVTGPLK